MRTVMETAANAQLVGAIARGSAAAIYFLRMVEGPVERQESADACPFLRVGVVRRNEFGWLARTEMFINLITNT